MIRSPTNSALSEISPGLFSAEGEEWRRERRIVAPAFNHGNISRHALKSIHLVASRLVQKWAAASEEGTAAIPVNADCQRFSADTITLVGFGHDFDSVTRGGGESEDLAAVLGIIFERQIAGPFK